MDTTENKQALEEIAARPRYGHTRFPKRTVEVGAVVLLVAASMIALGRGDAALVLVVLVGFNHFLLSLHVGKLERAIAALHAERDAG